jgi:O-antigen ligase
VLTYSRGALLATIGGFVTLALISKKIRVKALITILFAFIILLGIFWHYAERPEMTRYDYRRIAADPNRFTAGRLERSVQVLEGFSELSLMTKLIGLGFGGELVTPLHWRFLYVDNLYLTLLFKMGIIGLVCLLSLLVQLFLTLLKLCRKIDNPATRSLIYGGIAGLVASLIHNLADTLWFFPPLSANFWFLAGISMCIGMIGARQTEAARQQVKTPRNIQVKKGR